MFCGTWHEGRLKSPIQPCIFGCMYACVVRGSDIFGFRSHVIYHMHFPKLRLGLNLSMVATWICIHLFGSGRKFALGARLVRSIWGEDTTKPALSLSLTDCLKMAKSALESVSFDFLPITSPSRPRDSTYQLPLYNTTLYDTACLNLTNKTFL